MVPPEAAGPVATGGAAADSAALVRVGAGAAPGGRGRARRSAAADGRDGVPASGDERPVLITGLCGRLGRRLARALHRERAVVGLDRRELIGCPKDIRAYRVDVRRKKTKDIFRQERPAAIVHLGVMHDLRASPVEHHSWNVVGFQRLLDYASQYGVPKIVVLSSANVYGARPDNAQFLDEDAPLLASESFSAVRDLVEVDMLAQSFFWKRPEIETVILRPVHILGTVRNAPSNYLRQPVVPTILGYDPMIQVIHQQDVVRAIMLALRPGIRGIFNVAGPSPAPLSRVVALTGRPRLAVPYRLFRTVLHRAWRWRASSFPEQELDFIRYVCMVDDDRCRRELGFASVHDLPSTVAAIEDVV